METAAACGEVKHATTPRRSLSRKGRRLFGAVAPVTIQEPPTLLNRHSRSQIPCGSAKVFVVEGYGADLIRRVLQKLGWRERQVSSSPCMPPHLIWNGSTTGRKLFKDEVFQQWQLLNHFPRSGVIGSKSGLLWNLRDHCACEAKMPLMSFLPRSYDLRSSRELRGFLLDFAVTKAEAILSEASSVATPSLPVASGLLQACRLLGRLSHAQVLQSQVLCGQRTSFRDFQEGIGFTHEDEWVLQSGAPNAEAKALLLRLLAEKGESEEGLILSAVVLEARWWREHLQQQEQRQFSLNGVHGFWILKEPSLNCGRGVQVFSELLPLLQEAERADWHVIVQKYIERPLLVAKKKCDLRLWVVVTCWNPAVIWVWPEPYLRLASRHFSWEQSQIADPFVHLTNRTVQRHDAPAEKVDEDEAHIMMLPAFFKWAEELEHLNAMSSWKERTWPKILEVVRTCVLSCKEDVGAHPSGCFELFGFDFLLDSDLTPWLLEANSSPDLCEDAGPSLRRMTETALTQLFELVQGLADETIGLKGAGKFDCPVPGSGDWHLILREETLRGTKELELRRAVRASRRPPSVSTAQSRHQHRDVLRSTLGCPSSVKRPEHKELGVTLQPKELILSPKDPGPRTSESLRAHLKRTLPRQLHHGG